MAETNTTTTLRPWPEVNAWRLRLHKQFDEVFASTQLPERPDYGWANEQTPDE